MKRIGIEINGVLRDTIGKFTQIYEHNMLGDDDVDSVDKTYELKFSGDPEDITENTEINNFKYELLGEVETLNLRDHFAFKDEDELYSFMYEDFVMQIFGHAGSTETFTFNDLNEIYLNHRDNKELLIVSDEMGKSKPASLFFLSKFGCLLEKVKFYSNTTINTLWDEVDVLLTANPDLIVNHPKDKVVVKFLTTYNKNVNSDYEIKSLKEFNEIIEKL
jgi:hypothetical protein